MSDEAPECLHHDGESPFEHMNLPRVTQVERRRDAELGQRLVCRPPGMNEIAAPLGSGRTPGRFR
jgi:hypothetical protein